jgi:hypothetical protein
VSFTAARTLRGYLQVTDDEMAQFAAVGQSVNINFVACWLHIDNRGGA